MQTNEVKHAYFSKEEGPCDLLGIVLRHVNKCDRASFGIAYEYVDFWASLRAYESGRKSFRGDTKDDIDRKGYIIHESREHAINALKSEDN